MLLLLLKKQQRKLHRRHDHRHHRRELRIERYNGKEQCHSIGRKRKCRDRESNERKKRLEGERKIWIEIFPGKKKIKMEKEEKENLEKNLTSQ
jgi:hypothetical protein